LNEHGLLAYYRIFKRHGHEFDDNQYGSAMTLGDTFGEQWIRFFIHPLKADAPLSFRTQLTKSKSTILACPPGDSMRKHRELILQILALFNNHGVIVCDDTGESVKALGYPSSVRLLPVPKMSRWQLLRSGIFKEIDGRFDTIIDLDPNYSLRHILLTRICSAPLRIGFAKERSDAYYNLQYNGRPAEAYEKRLEGMHRFLKQFFSDGRG
jgi:hypothetical protein